MNNTLQHVGVGHDDSPPGRGSGRYAYGSGENPGQHQFTFLSEVSRMKKDGYKDAEIAKILLGNKATSTDLRAEISIQKSQERNFNRQRAIQVLDECKGNKSEAARRLGMKNESSLRSLLDSVSADRNDRYRNTAEMLKKNIEKQDSGMIDISKGTELYLGVNKHTMDVAVKILEKEGYLRSWVKIPQVGTTHDTTVNVLAKPGTTHGDVQRNKYDINGIVEYTPDKGKTWWAPEFPTSVDSKRVLIRYKEEGGAEKDGVIELRPGVEDISLDGSRYAQVRIAVDDKYYMKGMALYGDIPDGYDIVYNSNKPKGTAPDKVFKPMKIDAATGEIDRDNPFGASIKSPKDRDGVITAGGQRHYIDKDGKDRLSPINKLQDEGDWDNWSRTLASQFLSKQPIKLINQQIDLSIKDRRNELDEIKNLTNPVIKKKMLEDYARNCDANASDLSVKGFKNQAYKVLLPIPSMKDNEIYAPSFKDGDTIALVRFPHGGVFEIPVLKVNNKHVGAKRILGNSKDAVGINSKVAGILSGADFDGDTAIAIPVASNNIKISYSKPLEGLVGFDTKTYKLPDEAIGIKPRTKQNEMGRVTNLITDMTVGGANDNEICRAVKHSMVVIDSEKHHLNYKQSEKDNDVRALKVKYQGVNPKTGMPKGASTILSRASSEIMVPDRKEITDVSKMTPSEKKRWDEGKIVYRETGTTIKRQITDVSKMTPDERKQWEAGKKVYRETDEKRTITISRMDAVDDAMLLVGNKDNDKEVAYANYANNLKSLANEARRQARSIKPEPVNKTSKETYAAEVKSLNAKLAVAQSNAPKERQAQRIANQISMEKIKANPDLDHEHKQRIKAQALVVARSQVGAKKEPIIITDKEWEAIQANAISSSKLSEIINNASADTVKKLATPRPSVTLTNSQLALAKSMLSSGMYTQSEVAERLGVSVSTINKAI